MCVCVLTVCSFPQDVLLKHSVLQNKQVGLGSESYCSVGVDVFGLLVTKSYTRPET